MTLPFCMHACLFVTNSNECFCVICNLQCNENNNKCSVVISTKYVQRQQLSEIPVDNISAFHCFWAPAIFMLLQISM